MTDEVQIPEEEQEPQDALPEVEAESRGCRLRPRIDAVPIESAAAFVFDEEDER